MKLYGFPASPNTWKVRAIASHLGIKLDFVLVDLTKPRTAEYLTIHPAGRTPALVDGDFVLTESNAIMQYLASQKPNALWPNDVKARALITRWQCWQLAHWSAEACQPLVFNRLVKQLLKLGPPDEAAVARATEAFNKECKLLDTWVSKHKYLVNDELTVADFAVAAPLFYAKQGQYPLGPYEHVQEWFGRISALPAWKETAPPPLPAQAA